MKAMFENILLDGDDSRSRGRSPNFSEGRYANHDEDSGDRRAQIKPSSRAEKQKRSLRESNNLNKSVEIFGYSDNRIETEPLVTDQNNALNTSFGVENVSDIMEIEEAPKTNKLFSSTIDEPFNRSKTPPISSKRPALHQDDFEFHKPIGAKEDFTIEEPVREPHRDDSYYQDSNPDTPEISVQETSNQEKTGSIFIQEQKSQVVKENVKASKTENSALSNIDFSQPSKRRDMLYDDEEEVKQKYGKSDNSESTVKKLDENIKSFYTPALSTNGGNQNKSQTISKGDYSVPISHTSSVKSLPDDIEKVTENLKAKKQECEELRKQLEEKENELLVQTQLNNILKIELQNERLNTQNNSANRKLEAENKELWEIINQMKKEQESFRNSIFLALKTTAGIFPSTGRQNLPREDSKHDQMPNRKSGREEIERQAQSLMENSTHKHLETMTQEMMNNAAGSGSNQEDYYIPEKVNNEGEYDDDNEYEAFEEEYNEEGTSGGNTKSNRHDGNYRRKFDPNDNSIEADDRVIQGNERRGRQKQSNKRRGHNINAQETGRDSADDYEEEKIPNISSSSGIQTQQYKKREKGKQSQPLGRQSEGPSTGQFSNITRHDPRNAAGDYMQTISGGSHSTHTNQQRHRQADPRQIFNTGDSSYNQKQNRKKDQKLSAESGGTDFNQNPSTPNQTEDMRAGLSPPIFQHDGNTQGAPISQRTPNRTNVPRLNIHKRTSSPDGDQRNAEFNLNRGANFEEDVLLGENEVLTPRRQEQFENDSKKTSGASTPSRDGADTPTRKNFNEHQQQLGENKGFIHDLTDANINRKYPIEKKRSKPHNNDISRNAAMMPSNNTYSQLNEQIDLAQPLSSQNSYDERDHRRGNYGGMDHEREYQNYQDNNYWEREQDS